MLKRWKFAARSEQLHGAQRSLLDEAIDADLEAIAAELATLRSPTPAQAPQEQPKRRPLPAHLPRIEVRHEPERTVCSCGCALKRIGEDVSGSSTTPRACSMSSARSRQMGLCEVPALIQAPVPAQVIDKGCPPRGCSPRSWWRSTPITSRCIDRKASSSGLALPYRARRWHSGSVFAACACSRWSMRCGRCCSSEQFSRPTDAVAMLKPGKGARTGRISGATARRNSMACTASFTTSPTAAPRRTQAIPRRLVGKLVCDDYSGYKGLFAEGVTEVGCLAHARRKFNDLWVNHKSPLAEEALQLFGKLYEVEREARELSAGERQRIRQLQARPIADKLREWLLLQRQKATDGTAIAKAIDYSLGRWQALTRFLDEARCRSITTGSRIGFARSRGPLELAVCRIAARGKACRRSHELDSIGQAQRPRPVSIPQRRPRETAHPTREPHRRIAAAQLDAGNDSELTPRIGAR